MSDHYDRGVYDDSVGWVVVDGLMNAETFKTNRDEWEKLAAVATPAERGEALRQLREQVAERRAEEAEVRRQLDEMVTRFPELKSVGRGRGST